MAEVIISAAILFMVTTGTLALIDGSARVQDRNRARTAAANIAEQDQERMRSTPVSTLGGPVSGGRVGTTTTTTQTVDGITYTVVSKAEWLRDSTGAAPSCADPNGTAEYLRLTSTVTNARASKLAPVVLTSLMAPEVGAFGAHTGTLSIHVVDRTGADLSGVTVTANGPDNVSAVTNAAGCAVFNYVTSGAYVATVNTANVVDVLGNKPPSVNASVNDGAVTTQDVQIGAPASVLVSIKTTETTPQPSKAFGVTLANSNMNINGALGTRTFPSGTNTTLQSSYTAAQLFPFALGYVAYSGTCTANNPANYTGGVAGTLSTLAPGASNVPMTVTQPLVTATVTRKGGLAGAGSTGTVTPVQGAQVHLYPAAVDSGCGGDYKFESLTSSTGVATQGVPWGHYTMCVAYTTTGSGTSGLRHANFPSTDNITKAGSSYPILLPANTSTIAGDC
jgi:Tfp pilus assembly protein PilV